MARGGGRLEAAARGRRPRGRGALGLLCLAALCGLGAAEAEFSILEEAQVLATQMRKLATEELGVVTMQVRPGRLSPLPPAWIALPPLSGFCPSFLFSFPPSSSSPPPFPHLPPPPVLPFFANFPSLCAGPALCAAIPVPARHKELSLPFPPPRPSRPEPRSQVGTEGGSGKGTVAGKCGFKSSEPKGR